MPELDEINLILDLSPKDLAVTEVDNHVADTITIGIEEYNGRIKSIVAAIIDVHKRFIDDTRGLKEKFARMNLETRRDGDSLKLKCNNVPKDSLVLNEQGNLDLMESQKEKIAKAIRDVILLPPSSPDNIKEYVRKFIDRTGLFDTDFRNRTFVWGGHSLPDGRNGSEYKHAKEIAYWDSIVNLTEYITGCGEDIMRAPFSGSFLGYLRRNLIIGEDRDFIGFTEQKILAAEPPNSYVNRLIVFPDIALRIIAFILASHRGRVHPGGVGTIEEIMSFLAVKSHDKNQDLHYPFDLVEPKNSTYMQQIQEYFKICFGDKLNHLFEVHSGVDPKSFAEHILETKGSEEKELWQEHIHIPDELLQPFKVTFKNMEDLDLSRDQDPYSLLINLRNFYSAIVSLTVKNPALLDLWEDNVPLIKGDKEIISATDRFIERFNQEGRIFKGTFKKPYRTE